MWICIGTRIKFNSFELVFRELKYKIRVKMHNKIKNNVIFDLLQCPNHGPFAGPRHESDVSKVVFGLIEFFSQSI
jgi:hypothetical protein